MSVLKRAPRGQSGLIHDMDPAAAQWTCVGFQAYRLQAGDSITEQTRDREVIRVFTEDGSLDETIAINDHDVVLVPRGHHPCAAPHDYDLYYLNVMAGPLRQWRFQNHPDHDWISRQA